MREIKINYWKCYERIIRRLFNNIIFNVDGYMKKDNTERDREFEEWFRKNLKIEHVADGDWFKINIKKEEFGACGGDFPVGHVPQEVEDLKRACSIGWAYLYPYKQRCEELERTGNIGCSPAQFIDKIQSLEAKVEELEDEVKEFGIIQKSHVEEIKSNGLIADKWREKAKTLQALLVEADKLLVQAPLGSLTWEKKVDEFRNREDVKAWLKERG